MITIELTKRTEGEKEAYMQGYAAGKRDKSEGDRIVKYIDGKERLPGIYLCDPAKNTECRKTSCQTLCFHTTHMKYATEEALKEAERIKEYERRNI